MSSMPPLLTPTGVTSAAQPSRAASAVSAKPARGFQVFRFRIDGYSWSKTLPAGERISSDPFTVGGRSWQIDYYPNGTDASRSDDSDAIAVYLRLVSPTYQGGGYRHYGPNDRVRAQFKFSLLDLTGSPSFELPAETGVFNPPNLARHHSVYPVLPSPLHDAAAPAPDFGCGNAEFITKEELERRGQSLLAEDRLAIRCDVGVMELDVVALGPNKRKVLRPMRGRGGRYPYGRGYSIGCEELIDYEEEEEEEEEDGEGSGPRQEPQDEREFIRQCLTQRRRTT